MSSESNKVTSHSGTSLGVDAAVHLNEHFPVCCGYSPAIGSKAALVSLVMYDQGVGETMTVYDCCSIPGDYSTYTVAKPRKALGKLMQG